MGSIIDNVLVGLAFLASALYVLSSLGPRSLRYRLLAAMSRWVARLPGLRRVAQRLAAAAGRAAGGGGCNSCSSSPAAAKAPRKGAMGVPAGKIGRRV